MDEEELNKRIKILKEYGGIWPPAEVFYIEAITQTAESSINAFIRYKYCLDNHRKPSEVMASLQEGLVHAASLSRFFWPSYKKTLHKIRAKRLREAYNLQSGSPLSNRKLRDGFEHFDERLDHFLMKNDAGTFIPQPLIGEYEIDISPTFKVFKFVDPEKGIVILLNEIYNFMEIADEVHRIFELSKSFDNAGGRLISNT